MHLLQRAAPSINARRQGAFAVLGFNLRPCRAECALQPRIGPDCGLRDAERVLVAGGLVFRQPRLAHIVAENLVP